MPETFRGRDVWTNFIGLAGLIGVLAIAFYFLDIEEMRVQIERAGLWAPLLFIFAKATTIVVAPLGGSPLYPIAGALFGFWKGIFLLVSGLEMMGTVKGFFIARVCLAAFPELASYAAGLTKLRFLPFIVIYSVIGIAPALVGVSLGSLLAEGRDGYVLGFAALLAGVLTVGGIAAFGWYARKKHLELTNAELPPSSPNAF